MRLRPARRSIRRQRPAKIFQQGQALLAHAASGRGLHHAGQARQLDRDVVQRIRLVVEGTAAAPAGRCRAPGCCPSGRRCRTCAPARPRRGRRGGRRPARFALPGSAARSRPKSCGPRWRGRRRRACRREAQRRQPFARQQRRLARGGGAGRIVLRQVDQVVQVAGGQHHQRVGVGVSSASSAWALRHTRSRWLPSWAPSASAPAQSRARCARRVRQASRSRKSCCIGVGESGSSKARCDSASACAFLWRGTQRSCRPAMRAISARAVAR
jgi:hypothetical protein